MRKTIRDSEGPKYSKFLEGSQYLNLLDLVEKEESLKAQNIQIF